MKIKFSNIVAASLIILGATQVNAASITGTIQLTRDSSRSINGAYLVTEKKDPSGKPIALVLVLDENGKAIAQQYENKQIRIDGNVQGRNLTAVEWKEVKDKSFSSGSSYNDSSSSSRDESYDDEEESEKEEDEEEEEEDSKKSKSKSKSKKKSSDDDDEDSDNEDDSDDSDNEKEDSDNEKEDSDDEKEDSDDEEKSDDED